jgi:cyclophilin family peptidyl-prolyl cis-trans isomerase
LFITVDEQPRLDGTHPVFGEVVDGMEVVHEIAKLGTDRRDRPKEDVVVEEVTIEGQLPGVDVETF